MLEVHLLWFFFYTNLKDKAWNWAKEGLDKVSYWKFINSWFINIWKVWFWNGNVKQWGISSHRIHEEQGSVRIVPQIQHSHWILLKIKVVVIIELLSIYTLSFRKTIRLFEMVYIKCICFKRGGVNIWWNTIALWMPKAVFW